ncbi:MAG: GNAT family N-acetyltransferase [Bacteroidetes bacterium]|nr:GNAT family N-acetyltransferase [Bacteroidota bacterium]
MRLELVRCETEDLEILRDIGLQAFKEAFGSQNNPSDFEAYIATAFDLKKLKEELENTASAFFFAKNENEIVGYLKVNFPGAQSDPQGQNCLEIERIYTFKSFFGLGVGEFLLNAALDIAKANDHDFLWLGVWEENHRAIRFYQKHGFEIYGKHDFWLGTDLQTDLLMRLMLKKGPNGN